MHDGDAEVSLLPQGWDGSLHGSTMPITSVLEDTMVPWAAHSGSGEGKEKLQGLMWAVQNLMCPQLVSAQAQRGQAQGQEIVHRDAGMMPMGKRVLSMGQKRYMINHIRLLFQKGEIGFQTP